MTPTPHAVDRIRRETERQASIASFVPSVEKAGRSSWYLFGHVVVAFQAVAAVGLLAFGLVYGLVYLGGQLARMGLNRQRVLAFIERNSVADVSVMVVVAVLFSLPLVLRLASRRRAHHLMHRVARNEALPSDSILTVV